MAQTPEGRVKAAVKKVLKQKGAWFYMPVQNGMGVVGIPDFVCCWRGRFLGIETKAPGKRKNLSANQAMQLGLIDDAEGLTLVVDDVQQLIDFFDGLTC
jgi:hypothetical protein